jgi:hypothetical protein
MSYSQGDKVQVIGYHPVPNKRQPKPDPKEGSG